MNAADFPELEPGINYVGRAADLEARAQVGAEYRLCCSPHEWTADDSEAMAKYVLAARLALQQERRDSAVLMELLAEARARQGKTAS